MFNNKTIKIVFSDFLPLINFDLCQLEKARHVVSLLRASTTKYTETKDGILIDYDSLIDGKSDPSSFLNLYSQHYPNSTEITFPLSEQSYLSPTFVPDSIITSLPTTFNTELNFDFKFDINYETSSTDSLETQEETQKEIKGIQEEIHEKIQEEIQEEIQIIQKEISLYERSFFQLVNEFKNMNIPTVITSIHVSRKERRPGMIKREKARRKQSASLLKDIKNRVNQTDISKQEARTITVEDINNLKLTELSSVLKSFFAVLHCDDFTNMLKEDKEHFKNGGKLNFVDLILNHLDGYIITSESGATAFGERNNISVTRPGLILAIEKLYEKAFVILNRYLQEILNKELTLDVYKGRKLLAVDAVKMKLANKRSKKLFDIFGGDKKTKIPMLSAYVIYDILNKQMINASYNPYNHSERTALYDDVALMKKEQNIGDFIVIGDRNTASCKLMYKLVEDNTEFLFRLKSTDYLKERNQLIANGKKDGVV